MKSISSIKTIERLRTLFTTFGLHKTLVSVDGTSFKNYEFKEFLNKNGVRFVLTPPSRVQWRSGTLCARSKEKLIRGDQGLGGAVAVNLVLEGW